ncbi:MAG: beta-lactamase family protein [Acidobacteria bacterium]|jgi:CubicO group peptidase (beta-lactamase class C family)|nr:beta-lactamase family protein [Acidobacteriota bacterium]
MTAAGPGPAECPRLDAWAQSHAARGDWPGCAVAVGPPGAEPRWRAAAGRLALEPEAEPLPAGGEALYDLASLTKPLVTAAVAARLADLGRLDLDAPLDALLPELDGYAGGTPSLAALLGHDAGLPAWHPLYRSVADATPERVAAAIAALPPAGRAGEGEPRYSDLGAILAAIACERATGERLDALFARLVRGPLRLEPRDCAFGPIAAPERARTAPTETGRRREAQLAGGTGGEQDGVPGPAVPLRGVVHDGNAAFLGGVAGHAGLFGTATAVFRLASACAGALPLFSPSAVNRFLTPRVRGARDAYTLGFQSAAAPKAPAGSAFGPHAVGHVGFTGASVFVDPRRPLVAVLLTNAVHPAWRDLPIRSWRIEFHDLAAALADGAPA